ncbi:unnamed protein product, partial [Iphiclides podalirius]
MRNMKGPSAMGRCVGPQLCYCQGRLANCGELCIRGIARRPIGGTRSAGEIWALMNAPFAGGAPGSVIPANRSAQPVIVFATLRCLRGPGRAPHELFMRPRRLIVMKFAPPRPAHPSRPSPSARGRLTCTL